MPRLAPIRSPPHRTQPPSACAAQGEKTNCVDQKNLIVYLADPSNPMKVYSYDHNGLQKSPSGWKASGDGAAYYYYLNVGEPIKKLPEASCSWAQGECQGGQCAGYQTSTDGSACYAVGDLGSIEATFYDPGSQKMGDPSSGVTIIMSSYPGCMADKRWVVIKLICGGTNAPGKSVECENITTCGLPVCVYEVFWTHPAGCPVNRTGTSKFRCLDNACRPSPPGLPGFDNASTCYQGCGHLNGCLPALFATCGAAKATTR